MFFEIFVAISVSTHSVDSSVLKHIGTSDVYTVNTPSYECAVVNPSFSNLTLVLDTHADMELLSDATPLAGKGVMVPLLKYPEFPHTLASWAQQKGAVLVLIISVNPGYPALTYWRGPACTIPVYGVSEELYVTKSVFRGDVTPSTNIYASTKFQAPYIFLCTLAGALSVAKIVFGSQRIFNHWRKSGEVTGAIQALFVELLSAILALACALDYNGLRHMYPTPSWYGLLSATAVVNFAATFVLARVFMEALEDVEPIHNAQLKKRVLFVLLVSVAGFSVYDILSGGFKIFPGNLLLIAGHIFSVGIFQGGTGVWLYRSKKKVLAILGEAEAPTAEQKKLKRFSHYLFLTSLLMIVYVMCIFLLIATVLAGASYGVVVFNGVSLSLGQLIGLAQIIALPKVPSSE